MTDINHRWLRDNDNEVFFPITHIDAVEGLEGISLTDINDKITEINTTLDTANATILEQQKIIDQQTKDIQTLNTGLFGMVDDSGWRDYQVANATKNGGFNGYSCQIRELVVGINSEKFMRIRTLRVNLGNVPHNVQIGQLPTGFVDKPIRFVASSSSGVPAPVVTLGTDGVVKVFFDSNYRDGSQNVYGQHTWITD